MSWQSALTFLGAIGLFLLGMRLMTEGLTSAAGNTLRAILSIATHSWARAIVSGIAITAIVQSSSAVIFMAVGFVNASLLSLSQAVGVIYGSNLGTTLTSWIVALLGIGIVMTVLMQSSSAALAVTLSATAGQIAKGAISEEVRHDDHLEQGHRALEILSYAISEFASGIPRPQMVNEQLNALSDAQRVAQYLVNVAEHARELVPDAPVIDLRDEQLRLARFSLRASAAALIDEAKVDRQDWDVHVLNEMRASFESQYQGLKASYLRAGTTGSLDPRALAP